MLTYLWLKAESWHVCERSLFGVRIGLGPRCARRELRACSFTVTSTLSDDTCTPGGFRCLLVVELNCVDKCLLDSERARRFIRYWSSFRVGFRRTWMRYQFVVHRIRGSFVLIRMIRNKRLQYEYLFWSRCSTSVCVCRRI